MAKNNRTAKNTDLTDSPADQEKLKNDTANLDLPDVSDIPGQAKIRPAPAGEMADTTASSADEEGRGVLDNNSNIEEDDSNVTATEKELLQRSADTWPNEEEEGLRQASLDETDFDGEPLNEESLDNAISGDDLDVPGADDDDDNEAIGEEDEENNAYSLGGDDND